MQKPAKTAIIACTALLIGLAAMPAGAVAEVPDACPDFDSLPDDALVAPTSYAGWPGDQPDPTHGYSLYARYTDADEIIHSRGLEAWHMIDGGAGDDTLFVHDPGNDIEAMGGPGSDVIVLCSMRHYRAELSLGYPVDFPDEDADTVVIEAAAFGNVAPGLTRRITIYSFDPQRDTLILRVPPSLAVTERPSRLDGTHIIVGDTVIAVALWWPEKEGPDRARRLLGSDSLVIEDAAEQPPAAAAATPPIPAACPSLDAPPSGAVVAPPGSYAQGFPILDMVSTADDTILSQGLPVPLNAMAGDDTLFLYEPAENDPWEGFYVTGGAGRDTLVLCSMPVAEGVLVTSGSGLAPDGDADLIVIEAAVFDGIPPGTRRELYIESFAVGSDTLVLRVPAATAVTADAMPATGDRFAQTKIAAGDVLITVTHPMVRDGGDEASFLLPGSGSLIIEPVS